MSACRIPSGLQQARNATVNRMLTWVYVHAGEDLIAGWPGGHVHAGEIRIADRPGGPVHVVWEPVFVLPGNHHVHAGEIRIADRPGICLRVASLVAVGWQDDFLQSAADSG